MESLDKKLVFYKDANSGVVEVKAGTLTSLVEQLAPDDASVDMTFVKEFLFCYRAFVAPRELLSLLVARWLYLPSAANSDVSNSDTHASKKPAVQLRVINIIKRWLESHACDFGTAEDLQVLETSSQRLLKQHAGLDEDDARQLADEEVACGAVVGREMHTFIAQ